MVRLRSGLALATVVLSVLTVAASASADPIIVTNAGQPGIATAPWQPPVELALRGSCPFARTLDEARGAPSPCPAGTWPAPGTDWSPTVEVASGDTLAFALPFAPTSVSVTGTTNYPVGLTTPDGTSVPNESLGDFAPTASVSGSATSWSVTVPPLDVRSTSEATTAVAITAIGAGGVAANAAFRIRTPRFGAAGQCGPGFFSATRSVSTCAQNAKGAPGGSESATGTVAAPGSTASVPVIEVRSPRLTRRCREITARMRTTSAEPLELSVTVRGTTRTAWKQSLTAGRWTTVHHAISAAVARKLAGSRSRPRLRIAAATESTAVRLDRGRCR